MARKKSYVVYSLRYESSRSTHGERNISDHPQPRRRAWVRSPRYRVVDTALAWLIRTTELSAHAIRIDLGNRFQRTESRGASSALCSSCHVFYPLRHELPASLGSNIRYIHDIYQSARAWQNRLSIPSQQIFAGILAELFRLFTRSFLRDSSHFYSRENSPHCSSTLRNLTRIHPAHLFEMVSAYSIEADLAYRSSRVSRPLPIPPIHRRSCAFQHAPTDRQPALDVSSRMGAPGKN